MADICRIENAIGETRACVYHARKAIELYVRRWSENGRPQVGEIFSGRVRNIDNQIMAAFVDLGFGAHGLLRFTMSPDAPRLNEGQMIRVSVVREAEEGKGPLLSYEDLSDAKDIGRETSVSLQDMIKARHNGIVFEEGVVGGVDWAWEPQVELKSGGNIYIEHTRAGTMIDVDTGAAPKAKTGIEAAREVARQLQLRGIGGLVLIDFPNFRKNKAQDDVLQTLEDGFKFDSNTVKIAPFSRFGTVELVRSRGGRSIAQTVLKHGVLSVETQAIGAIRRLMNEAVANAGSRLVLSADGEVFNWLDKDAIGWKQAVTDKIGARFKLVQADKIDVYIEQ